MNKIIKCGNSIIYIYIKKEYYIKIQLFYSTHKKYNANIYILYLFILFEFSTFSNLKSGLAGCQQMCCWFSAAE